MDKDIKVKVKFIHWIGIFLLMAGAPLMYLLGFLEGSGRASYYGVDSIVFFAAVWLSFTLRKETDLTGLTAREQTLWSIIAGVCFLGGIGAQILRYHYYHPWG